MRNMTEQGNMTEQERRVWLQMRNMTEQERELEFVWSEVVKTMIPTGVWFVILK